MIDKMADDRRNLLDNNSPNSPSSAADDAIYGEQSTTTRYLHIGFVGAVASMVLLSIILSIYSGAQHGVNGALYFMLGISLIGFVVIEVFLVVFIRNGDLPANKSWFLYLIGGCIILESIFTDVLVTR